MPTTNPVPSQDPGDLLFNAGKLDEVVNGGANTFTDRSGVVRRTLAGLSAEFPNAAANAAAAAASASDAANEAASAASAADAAFAEATSAQASRVATEAARDAAMLSAGVYATTAAGLAATTNGKYFSVPSAASSEYLILYQNNSGAAVEVKRYPSSDLVETHINKNARIYDLKNRARFVSGEIYGPVYPTNLASNPNAVWSISSGALQFTGVGLYDIASMFWLGHVRITSRNTEVVVRLTLNGDYGTAGGPGPQVFFGNESATLRGIQFSNNGQIYVMGANGLATGEGASPVTPAVAFVNGDSVEMRIVLRSNGTGFVVGKNLTKGASLTLQIPNISTFQAGRIWISAHKAVARTITHFEVKELEIVPEDFDTAAISSRLTAAETDISALEQQAQEKFVSVPYPAGFSMYSSIGINVVRGLSSKSFGTTLNPDNYLISTSVNYYINGASGSDSNNGSSASPFKTLKKAIEAVNAGGVPATINAASGEYLHDAVGVLPSVTQNFNLVCSGSSPAEFALASIESGWVADSTYTNLWKVTVTGAAPIGVYDRGDLDEYGTPKGMIARTIDAANTTPGSYYVSGNTIYVRLYNSRQPDSNVRVTRDMTGLTANGVRYYMKNVVIRGGNGSGFTSNPTTGTCLATECKFTHAWFNAAYIVRNLGLVIMHNCEAAWAQTNDGFNYTTGGIGCDVVEINCIGHHNGLEKGSTNNGSTIHSATRCIRVNCEYKYNNNKNIADTHNNSMSWNMGVIAGGAKDTGAPGRSTNFTIADGAKMWLDSCISEGGSLTDFEITAASVMYVRNTDTVNLKSIINGGSLAAY